MADALARQTWDLVLSDYSMPQFGALAAVRLVAKADLDLPFIVVSGSVGEEAAVEVMREGAHDFLFKGKLTRMIPVIERELREAARRAQHRDIEGRLRQMEKMEALGQLTGGIAHDFNNILAVIIGMAELASASVADDPKISAMLKQIDESAERGAQLVQRLLAFARKRPLETRVIDLNAIVHRVTAVLERTLGEHIVVQTSLSEGLWPALTDASQLEDALLNLVVNARDAMPDGGRVLIETSNVQLDERLRCPERGGHRRRLRRDHRHGHRYRHAARGHRARVRAVLHDQGGRPRHGPWPQHGLRLRQAVRRPREDLQRGRSRHEHQAVPAEGRQAGAIDRSHPRCTLAVSSCQAPRPFWSSRTTRPCARWR